MSLPVLLLLALLAWGPSPVAAQDASPVDVVVRGLERDPVLGRIHWGVLVRGLHDGRVVYAHNAGKKLVPASNVKLFTGAAALSLLGPDHRYRTRFLTRGRVADGVLEGDLVLPGDGDPTLGPPFHDDAGAALAALADSLAGAGVRRVTGALLVDVSAWDSLPAYPPTWMIEDIPFSWAAAGGPFAVGRGRLLVEVTPGRAVGNGVRIRWGPRGTPDFLENRLVTAPADSSPEARPRYLPESGRIVLEGGVPLGGVDTLELNVVEPARQGGWALVRALARRGVEVEEGVRVIRSRDDPRRCVPGAPPPACRELAGMDSPPMVEVVRAFMEPSENWIADQVLRSLGAVRGDRGGWKEGLRVVREWLEEVAGADSLEVTLLDGSGLSAYNLSTPRVPVEILTHMARSPHADAFRSALAAPGEEESTLEDRLLDLEGRLFAKTGTLTHAVALSGYLVTDGGRELVFSILANNSGLPSPVVRRALDGIVRAASGLR